MNFNCLEMALKRSGDIPVEEWLLHDEQDEQSVAKIDDILKLASTLLSRDLTEIFDSITS